MPAVVPESVPLTVTRSSYYLQTNGIQYQSGVMR